MALGVTTLSGCGGAGGSEPASSASAFPPPLPRAEFVSKANKLCEERRLEAELKATRVFRSKSKLYIRNGNYAEYRPSIKRQELSIVVAPSMIRRMGAVRALGIPSEDKQQVEKILETTRLAAVAARNNPFEFLANKEPMAPARALARDYGIESCAVLLDPNGAFQRASARPGVRLTPRSSK